MIIISFSEGMFDEVGPTCLNKEKYSKKAVLSWQLSQV